MKKKAKEKTKITKEAIKPFLLNFLIWFIPGLFVLVLVLLLLLLIAIIGEAFGLEKIEKLRQGLLSYLGITLCLSGLTIPIYWIIVNSDLMDTEFYIFTGTISFLCLFLGIHISIKELRRISKKLQTS